MKRCLQGVKICSFYITFSDLKVNVDTMNFNEAEVKQCLSPTATWCDLFSVITSTVIDFLLAVIAYEDFKNAK